MKKVIISGAAGFIGNAVARQLASQGISVTAIVRPGSFQSDEAFRLAGLNADILECDLKEIDKLPSLIHEKGFDVFYQFAWDGTDRDGIMDCNRQIDNIKWSVNSVKAAAALNCKKYIGAGSINQLELLNWKGQLHTEDRHKYYRAALSASECMGRAAAVENGMAFVWPILINVYGEGETAPRLVNNTIRNLLENKKLSFSPGEQLYDFIHIEDAARAFCLLGETGRPDTQYIIGSGEPRPLREYLKLINEIVAPEIPLGLGELEYCGIEMTRDMFDTGSLIRDTGFAPAIDFESGIRSTLEWIKREKEGTAT